MRVWKDNRTNKPSNKHTHIRMFVKIRTDILLIHLVISHLQVDPQASQCPAYFYDSASQFMSSKYRITLCQVYQPDHNQMNLMYLLC